MKSEIVYLDGAKGGAVTLPLPPGVLRHGRFAVVRKHPARPDNPALVAVDAASPLADGSGTLPHEWFVAWYQPSALNADAVDRACGAARAHGAFAVRVIVRSADVPRWGAVGFAPAETGLTPDGSVCVASVPDVLRRGDRERMVRVVRGDPVPRGTGSPSYHHPFADFDRSVADADDGSAVAPGQPPRLAILPPEDRHAGTMRAQTLQTFFPTRPARRPPGTILPAAPTAAQLEEIRTAAASFCPRGDIEHTYVEYSVGLADVILVTRSRSTGAITAVVTVISDPARCLAHEWYIDLACASSEHRGANRKIMASLAALAAHNGIQALRMHSTPRAAPYWKGIVGFRAAETVRDARGRCLYSLPRVDVDARTGLERLVLVLGEDPPVAAGEEEEEVAGGFRPTAAPAL